MKSLFISALVVIAAISFVEAQMPELFTATYILDSEYSESRWVPGPSFEIFDTHCSGYLNITAPDVIEKFCPSWNDYFPLPTSLEITTKDVHPYPSYTAIDHKITAFAIWRAACSGHAHVTTRVKCPNIRRSVEPLAMERPVYEPRHAPNTMADVPEPIKEKLRQRQLKLAFN